MPFLSKIEYLRTAATFYHPIEKVNYFVTSTLMMTGGESALRLAKNIQRPETERSQSRTHQLMQKL